MPIHADDIKTIAAQCGFELTGIAAAAPAQDFARFDAWRQAGMAGEMRYLTDHRGDKRADPKTLLASAQSIVCVGKLYHTDRPLSIHHQDPEAAWISRYAWGGDYHDVMRAGLERMVQKLIAICDHPFEWKICVDTAPLLERTYAQQAGLGWIGRNTCLINQQSGSWFVLGELLLSLSLAPDTPPPDRCGTCRRCIDACPTSALVPDAAGHWRLDSRLCISYLTIEQRSEIPSALAVQTGNHVFGCDICQDVCPWNRRAPVTQEPAFFPLHFAESLVELANLSEHDFRQRFESSPVQRSRYSGFLRNVAVAMGNAGTPQMLEPLQRLATNPDAVVAGAAKAALLHLERNLGDASNENDGAAACLGSNGND